MVKNVSQIFQRNPFAINHFETAILKMYYLDLDIVKNDFASLFLFTGRPSDLQPEIFRYCILISHFKHADIDGWIARAAGDPIICALVGVDPGSFPGASTHRDFMARLWMANKAERKRRVLPKPRGKHGKQKQPVKHPRIVATLVEKALSGHVF